MLFRSAIPPTVLLTLIFLQQSYQGELPALAYSTYLDWLYSFSFVIAFALFCLFCWGINTYDKARANQEESAALKRINHIDLIIQLSATIGFSALLLWGYILSRST